MAKTVDPNSAVEELPDFLQKFKAANRPMKLEEMMPGDQYLSIRASLEKTGKATYTENGLDKTLSVLMHDGYVMSTAAVARRPGRSYDFVREITDFTASSTARKDKIPVFYRVYQNDGMVSNGINKLAGLVSHEGKIYVKNAKKGKRKASAVKDELTRVLDYWLQHLNAQSPDLPITGARGAAAVMEKGTRQALIEGSFIGYAWDHPVKIPSLDGKSWNLPMVIQAMTTEHIEVPTWSEGTGFEQFYWVPPRQLIQQIRQARTPEEKAVLQKAIPQDVLSQLADSGRYLLEPHRVMHISHRGVDFRTFGESFIEPLMSDVAYKRALQQLDFVTIDSLVNRIVIIMVGSDDPDSAYHNQDIAQLRLQHLQQTIGDPGPNMQVLWAGPDLEVIEVSAHESILDIDGRHDIAVERMLLAMGIPRALLDGKDATGQVWAGYEGLRETLRAMVNNWANCWTTLAERIAINNGYDDVELVYVPVRSVLADQNAGADLALRAHKAGLASIRRTVEELGGNFEAERRNRIIEMGLDPDDDPDSLPSDMLIFSPPMGMPGDTRTDPDGNVIDPGGESGRPPDTEREDIAPERAPENRRNRPQR